MDLQPGDTIDHFRILERLGSGGMGDVFRAEDLRLRRIVALKTLRDDTLAEEATARLLGEARAASALNHPHIAVIYEIAHASRDGQPLAYIAMEYVEGTTLAAMAAERSLELDVVLDVFEQIGDALAEAERFGIVHRDLKPANVMVTPAGRVKLLDFGVAQQRRRHGGVAADDPTRTSDDLDPGAGFAGTIGYAAPEQMSGRDVDIRADLFSAGVMLYELVCGVRPFAGDNAAQVLEAMLTRDPPPFPEVHRDPRLPVLERYVRRLLARDRDDRPPTAADVRATLASIRSGTHASTSPAHDAVPGLVVTGFTNISSNPDDEWLGTGIAETLTMDSAQIESVTVVPRERVSQTLRALRQQTHEPDERLYIRAARALGARWAVGGGFQRSGDAVRVTASLIDVGSGEIVRTARVDGRVDAIFDLQDRLVRELANWLRAAVSPHPTSADTTAFEAFSRGMLNRQDESFEALDRAVVLFERAVTIDPAYARAHAELGSAWRDKADYLSMPELNTRALVSLRRALELQPGSARAWREIASALLALGQDVEGMAAIDRALAIEPDDASSIGTMGRALFIAYARFGEAAEWFERAVERNANAGWYWLQLAHCAALLRDFPRGERAAARSVELQEAFLSGRQGLFITGGYMRSGHLAALQGRHDDAVERFEREVDFLVRTEHPLRHRIVVELNARLGAAYLQLGDRARANAVFDAGLESFDRRVRLGADDPFTRYYAAAIHALRGDPEPALDFLERAMAQRPAFTAARAVIEPEFASLHADARFQRMFAAQLRR